MAEPVLAVPTPCFGLKSTFHDLFQRGVLPAKATGTRSPLSKPGENARKVIKPRKLVFGTNAMHERRYGNPVDRKTVDEQAFRGRGDRRKARIGSVSALLTRGHILFYGSCQLTHTPTEARRCRAWWWCSSQSFCAGGSSAFSTTVEERVDNAKLLTEEENR